MVDLVVTGPRRLFAYLAADAFYYLQVARNWADLGRISFDQEHPTNGFHPLWQAVEAAVWWVGDAVGLAPTALLWVVVLAGLAALAATLVVLARTITVVEGDLPPLFALLPVGLYGLLLIPAWVAVGALDPAKRDPFEGSLPLYGTLWSYANGMETPLVLLAFAIVLAVAVRRPASGLSLGVALSLLVLARLDTGLVAAAIVGVLLVAGLVRRDRSLVRTALVAAGVVALALVVYAAWNQWYAGTPLPVSGTRKTTFPRPTLGNARDVRELLTGNTLFGPERLYRQAPVLLPAVFAVAYLATRLRVLRRGDLVDAKVRYRLALLGTAVGVLLLAAYDWFFVPGFHQGHWYWPVSTLFVSLAALDWIGRRTLPLRPVLAVAAVVCVAVFVGLGRTDDYHRRYAAFWFDEAERVQAAYGDRRPKLLAIEDGIDSFTLGWPAMSGVGLALDEEASEAYERGDLLAVALDRGYDRISSLVYVNTTGLTLDSPSDEIRDRLAGFLPGQDLDPYSFEVEHLSEPFTTPFEGASGRYALIRVTRVR